MWIISFAGELEQNTGDRVHVEKSHLHHHAAHDKPNLTSPHWCCGHFLQVKQHFAWVFNHHTQQGVCVCLCVLACIHTVMWLHVSALLVLGQCDNTNLKVLFLLSLILSPVVRYWWSWCWQNQMRRWPRSGWRYWRSISCKIRPHCGTPCYLYPSCSLLVLLTKRWAPPRPYSPTYKGKAPSVITAVWRCYFKKKTYESNTTIIQCYLDFLIIVYQCYGMVNCFTFKHFVNPIRISFSPHIFWYSKKIGIDFETLTHSLFATHNTWGYLEHQEDNMCVCLIISSVLSCFDH